MSGVEVRMWILYAHIEWELNLKKEGTIILNGEEMEEVNEFKYLGSVMCKQGSTGETRERALQEKQVLGSLGHIMKGRSVSMEVKRDLRNTIQVTLGYRTFRYRVLWLSRMLEQLHKFLYHT